MKLWKFRTDDSADVDPSDGTCVFCAFVSENFETHVGDVVFVSTERDGGKVRRVEIVLALGKAKGLQCEASTVESADEELRFMGVN